MSERFEKSQSMQIVFGAEAGYELVFMLVNPAVKVIGHAGIQHL